MKNLQIMVAVTLLLLLAFTGSGQAGTVGQIKGTITDAANGEPLIGASVVIEGTTLGALTDLDGKYAIPRVEPGAYTLRVTSVGYGPVEITDVVVTADLTTEVSQKLSASSVGTKTQTVRSKRDVIVKNEQSGQVSKKNGQPSPLPMQIIQAPSVAEVDVRLNSIGDTHSRGGRAGESQSFMYNNAPQSPLPPFDMFFRDYGTNGWTRVNADPLSTFAVDVDDASYNIVKQYLIDGNLPPADAVRVEEFINHFNYGYRPPQTGKFRVFTETTISPFDHNTAFLKVGIKGKEIVESRRQPLRLTAVIDVSGSMGYDGRLELVKRGLHMIVDRLTDDDQIGIVTFGPSARVVLSPVSGNQKRRILDVVDLLFASGSTFAEAGLKLGYEMASDQYTAGHSNRIFLCSDGVANVGRTGPEEIMREVTRNAQTGITLSAFGFGMGNYNDALMEKLAQKGNGRYAYVNNWDEARRQFVEQMVSNVQVLARDVKIQVVFDQLAVASYRLIGYENRAVADNKFRDNKTDGGEIGAGHEVTALYELQLSRRSRSSQLATVTVRWKEPNQRTVQEISEPATLESRTGRYETVRPELQLAVIASRFGEMLKGTTFAEETSYDELQSLASRVAKRLPNEQTRELVDLISRARNLTEGYEYWHAFEDDNDDDNYKR
jgi:Ca-activated chloride channel family protein